MKLEWFGQRLVVPTIKRARPCSSMSGTKSSIGLGGRGVKALCGRATSWGQSSAEGTPTTLWDENGHQCQQWAASTASQILAKIIQVLPKQLTDPNDIDPSSAVWPNLGGSTG